MDWEKLMKIYNSCWFETEILKTQPRSSNSSGFEENPDRQIQETPSKTEILRVPSIRHRRSWSCQLSSKTSLDSLSLSPDSVLFPSSKLKTIVSGKESTEDEEEKEEGERLEAKQTTNSHEKLSSRRKFSKTTTRRRKKNGGESKSLSDLEFEELKGFMDLGFVFTEEDRNSSLVEIVPGLQRLGKKDDGDGGDDETTSSNVSRPYLSEAWEVLDRRRKENGNQILMNLRIPALSNEIDMKDTLRYWAHTVASAVK